MHMCRVPFKEHCLRFWPLNNSFKELNSGTHDGLIYAKNYNRFNTTDKCLSIDDKNFWLTIGEKYLPEGNMTLIFQTKKLYIDDITEIMNHRFMESDNDIDVFSFDFKTNISILENDKKWVTHVIVYEKDRTTYYIDGMIASIRESGRRFKGDGITLNEKRNKNRVICTGNIRNIGVYDIPFSYRMVKSLEYFDYYNRSILNMIVNHMIKKQDNTAPDGESSWT